MEAGRLAALLAALLGAAGAARAQPQELAIATAEGTGRIAVAASAPLEAPGAFRQALVILHGARRNADDYFRTGERAAAAAGVAQETLVLAPRFAAAADLAAGERPEMLRWAAQGWMEGGAALGPAAVSSFAVLDALLLRLSDRARYPALRRIVLAGHSAGAQLLQRYAVMGRAEDAPGAAGIALRFVVANPSSYLYFSPERPEPAIAAACPAADRWKYGLQGAPADAEARSPAALEAAYVRRDLIYLLGGADTDPQHRLLDRSCAGLAQGPNRHARGEAFFRYLAARHPEGLAHRLMEVPGVGHDQRGMFTASCGLAALFAAQPEDC